VLVGQLSVGWSNDYFDRDYDRRGNRLDKPIVTGAVSATVVQKAAVIAVVLCLPLSLLSGWRAAVVHLVAVAAAWGYNAGIKRTVLSVLPYLLAFGALPAFVTLGLDGHPWPQWWATLAAALLGAGAHFVNTVADAEVDAQTGVRGLPQMIGPVASVIVGSLLMAAAFVLVALASTNPGALTPVLVVLALLGTVAVAIMATTGHARSAWFITLITALVGAGALIAQGSTAVA